MKKISLLLISLLFILIGQTDAATLTQKIGSVYISQTVRPGQQVTLRFVNQPDFEFETWELESGNVSIDTTSMTITFTMPETNVVLRGKYKAVEKQYYTVTFDANGGTGAMTAQTIEQGKTAAITANSFTRNGYSFSGWSTSSNGSVEYANQSNIKPSGNITLYAIWQSTQNGTAKLVYNANNGTGAPAEESYTLTGVETSHNFTISATAPTRSGYTFKGWSTTSTGSVGYTSGNTISVGNETKTIYAVWELNQNGTAKLVYNANNGTGAPSEESYTLTGTETSHSFTISATAPTRSGHTFKGWSTSSSATTASYTSGNTISVGNETKTIYAVWEIISNGTAQLVYNANGGYGAPSMQSYSLTGITTSYTFTISSTVPSRSGFDFEGWSTSATGRIEYIAGNTISVGNETKTLYASWRGCWCCGGDYYSCSCVEDYCGYCNSCTNCCHRQHSCFNPTCNRNFSICGSCGRCPSHCFWDEDCAEAERYDF